MESKQQFIERAYEEAKKALRGCSHPMGFKAFARPDGYPQILARDSMIISLGPLAGRLHKARNILHSMKLRLQLDRAVSNSLRGLHAADYWTQPTGESRENSAGALVILPRIFRGAGSIPLRLRKSRSGVPKYKQNETRDTPFLVSHLSHFQPKTLILSQSRFYK